ncbi:MAG: exosome complex protein Rrp42 [Candidatus Micrarchaeota archaeon]
MSETKDLIMANVRKDVMLNTLAQGKRYDGRALDEMRPAEVHKGVITTAEGSALANIGQTQVLAAVKFDIMTPFPDRPNLGVFMTNSELLPLASPIFETGPPREDAIELARVVDRAIRSAEIIDLESFYIEEDKVLGLFIDLYVLNHAGNYTDASTMAATAALMDTQVPKVEDGKIVRGEYIGALNLKALPFSTTFVNVGGHWLVDPTRDEELVKDSSITIATTEEHVCAAQKSKGSLTREELMANIDTAFNKGNEQRKIVQG